MIESIAVGALVEHTVWGRGKAVEVRPPHLVVHFPSLAGSEQGPLRTLQVKAEQLSLAAVQSDPALDGVGVGAARPRKPKPEAGDARRGPAAKPLEFAVEGFRAAYPGLFQDRKLAAEEIETKRAAHRRFVEGLGDGRGRELVSAGSHAEITSILTELVKATNLPSPFERMAACDGLKDGPAATRLLGAVLDFADEPSADAFEGLCAAVGRLPTPGKGSRALTWPNVTILPFLADPSRFMVLKPGIARQTAARMGFDLPYVASPTWSCYDALMRMSGRLRDELRPLGAVDYVDVLAFMWVTRELE